MLRVDRRHVVGLLGRSNLPYQRDGFFRNRRTCAPSATSFVDAADHAHGCGHDSAGADGRGIVGEELHLAIALALDDAAFAQIGVEQVGAGHHRTAQPGTAQIGPAQQRAFEVGTAQIGLEEHRAVELIRSSDGNALAGVLFVDMRSGEYVFVRARAVLLATGGGPTMYKYHTPSGDKSCDGLAMALRAGLSLRDMEMVQFHPTGLLAGTHTRMTGTVLEEGLRGAGGHLLNGAGERFMPRYHRLAERATRDLVSRSMFEEIRKGNTSPHGGLYISMGHLGRERVAREFKGMVERCADCGFDLAGGRVEVVPTAHYMMGGVEFRGDCSTALPGLYVAGEDSGGVHGANRLGGNGVANSTVFGAVAGDVMARLARERDFLSPDEDALEAAVATCEAPFRRNSPGRLEEIRESLYDTMWEKAGIIRDAGGRQEAQGTLAALETALDACGLPDHNRAFNLAWHDWMNLKSLVTVSRAIAAAAAARRDSRGAHFRSDFPESGPLETSAFTSLRLEQNAFVVETKPVKFTRVQPGQTLLKNVA